MITSIKLYIFNADKYEEELFPFKAAKHGKETKD